MHSNVHLVGSSECLELFVLVLLYVRIAVISTGPMRATATFVNKEEIDLVPVYRDPVQDFGFFAFNPAAVKYMNVVAIELAPNVARVGLEIRVVGNDNGK